MARKRTLASIEKDLSIARTRKESAQSELDKAAKYEEISIRLPVSQILQGMLPLMKCSG